MTIKRHYLTRINQVEQLDPQKRAELEKVTNKFAFRCNDYYLSLIDWNDPNDPIRRLIVPNLRELAEWGRLDPSSEESYRITPGLEHKYNSTALLLVSNVCEGICRYCFRKRVFISAEHDHLRDLPAAIDYIRRHTEITNVLLTGGDPLVLTTGKLEPIIRQLREIEHVQVIRIGTKMPAFNPYRILDDPTLTAMIERYSTPTKAIYFMTHFIHPRELTEPAVEALYRLRKAGAVVANQCPIIRGINDSPVVLAELLRTLSFIGAAPYYVFQCRPSVGNKAYTVPVETGYEIFDGAMSRVSGLAKRPRFVLSHSTGKVEILGMTDDLVFFKYHRAADKDDSGRLIMARRNPEAYWLDDYEEVTPNSPADLPYRLLGPE